MIFNAAPAGGGVELLPAAYDGSTATFTVSGIAGDPRRAYVFLYAQTAASVQQTRAPDPGTGMNYFEFAVFRPGGGKCVFSNDSGSAFAGTCTASADGGTVRFTVTAGSMGSLDGKTLRAAVIAS